MPGEPAKPESTPAGRSQERLLDRRKGERRRFERFPLDADAEVVEVQTGTRIKGRVTDISLGGCYVDTLSPFLVSTAVQIRITRGSQSFEARANVVHMKLGLGMGLAFIAAQGEQKKVLGRWIVELGGELPAALAQNRGDGVNVETPNVLAELILALMKKGVLSEAEGQEMLRKARH